MRVQKSGPKKKLGERKQKACESCRASHVTCDKAWPACGNCLRTGKECRRKFFGEARSAKFVAINA